MSLGIPTDALEFVYTLHISFFFMGAGFFVHPGETCKFFAMHGIVTLVLKHTGFHTGGGDLGNPPKANFPPS